MVTLVSMAEARRQLSAMVAQAAAGEEVIIVRHGKPQARLTALAPARGRIQYGLLKGTFTIPEDFDAPDPEVEAWF